MNGAAPALFCSQASKFSKKKIPNAMPGNVTAALTVIPFQSPIANILAVRATKYPLKNPMAVNSNKHVVMSPPLFAGDKKPSTANTITTNVIPIN